MVRLFSGIKSLFQKTSSLLGSKIRALLGGKVDETVLEQLEELFFEADLGAKTSEKLTEKVRALYRQNGSLTADGVLKEIRQELSSQLQALEKTTHLPTTTTPQVILIVGVNGNGKTTTIAKLAKKFKYEGKQVLVAAADTFRAAAVSQLETWAKRTQVDIVKGRQGADPAAVVFDAIEAAKARDKDVVLIDTAGRLHTKHDLMQELEKIKRVSDKALPGAPHETYLILDATIGQNAVAQAIEFQKVTPLTGLILTKLDGTAKGGAAIAIQERLQLPIKYIGVGEGIDDLRPFDPIAFIQALIPDS